MFKKSKGDFILNAMIILFCICSLFPIYWLFSGSFKFSGDIVRIPPQWFPTNPTLANYRNIFLTNPAWRWIANSLIVSVVSTAGIIFTSSAAGYVLSKVNFIGKRIIFGFVIATLILTLEVYLLPLFQMMVTLDWIGTLRGLIVPELVMPFGVFLLKQYYDSLPNELLEAADMDGCGKIRFFWLIGMPLSKPAIGALAILAFIRVWNNYLWQFVMQRGRESFTLPVGVASLFDDPNVVDHGIRFAGASVAAIPLLIIFAIFQRFFTSGITAGSVKG